jgi:hypothetical protein
MKRKGNWAESNIQTSKYIHEYSFLATGLLAVCSTTSLQPNHAAETKTQSPAKPAGCCV